MYAKAGDLVCKTLGEWEAHGAGSKEISLQEVR